MNIKMYQNINLKRPESVEQNNGNPGICHGFLPKHMLQRIGPQKEKKNYSVGQAAANPKICKFSY